MTHKKKYTDYPKSDLEAKNRYKMWKATDPYPKIETALLNSADIKAYVKTTGMIYPFDENELQGASYKVKIGGEVIFWRYSDSSKKKGLEKVKLNLEKNLDGFDLAPNSIAFVALEPCFRIPEYIALRFNLKIKHIYKGLLLGTGPLVDPGFSGKLFIPLHNLTSNTYHFKYGDTLITMEFTKLSRNQRWNNLIEGTEHSEVYKEEKIPEQRDVEQYLSEALSNDRLDSVVSSIPDALHEGKVQVKEAQKEAARIRRWSVGTSLVSVITVATLVISTIGVTLSGYSRLTDQYNAIVKEYGERITVYENSISELEEEIEKLQLELNELNDTGFNTSEGER